MIFTSARYANPEQTAVLAVSETIGHEIISLADCPERWAELVESGVTIEQFAQQLTIDDFRRAIQAHVDATARSRSYDSGVTCSSYVGSTNAVWAAEAWAFVAWRDALWAHAYVELAKVQGGQRPVPTISALIDELPTIVWPV